MPANVEFVQDHDLKNKIRRIIEKYPQHFNHLNASYFIALRRNSDTAAKWIAKTTIVPKKLQGILDSYFIIEVDNINFGFLNDEQKDVILFQQLCSTILTDSGAFKLIKPDVQEYLAVIEEFGAYMPELNRIFQIINKKNSRKNNNDEEEELELKIE